MDILDFFNVILLITILYTFYKEDKVIENFEQSIIGENKIQYALQTIKLLSQPKNANPNYMISLLPEYTVKVDRLWIDDEFLIESIQDNQLRLTRNKPTYSTYTN
jgi:hypothetical protein